MTAKGRNRRFGAALAAVAMVLATAGGLAPAARAAVSPASVSVLPGLAWPGLPARVTGAGFTAAEPVVFTFDGAPWGRVPASPAGGFVTRLRLPGTAAPGPHRLVARQGTRSASATVRARLQWTQPGLYASHRGFNWYEHRLTAQTVARAGLIYRGESWQSPGAGGMVLTQGVIAYGTNQGAVGINAATGRVRWNLDLGSSLSGVAYDPGTGLAYFAGSTPYLYAVDPLTGKIAWSVLLPGITLASQLILADGTLYTAIGNGTQRQVVAVDVASRTVRWTSAWFTDHLSFSPVLSAGMVYAAGHFLSAYDAATGETRWNVPISDDPQALSGQLAADTTGLVIGSDDRRTRSFDPATGRLQWATDPLGDPGEAGDAVATANGRAFICYGSQVYALDETTGAVLWQRPSTNGSLVVANGLLYSPILDPAAQTAAQTAVDAATGELRATFQNTSASFAEPIVADGIIYFPGLGSVDAYGLPGTAQGPI